MVQQLITKEPKGKITIIADYAEDIERMVEQLTTTRGNFIVDKTSFEVAFDNEFFFAKTKEQKAFRNDVFQAYRIVNPNVPDKRIFKRRIEVTEKSTKLVFKKEGKLSQQELDKFASIPRSTKIQKDRLIHTAIRKGQIVFAERIFVVVLGKKQERFRDKTGKFCSKKS